MERKKRARKDRADMRERVCRALDIFPDTLGKAAVVEIRGRNFVYVRQGSRILLYTPEKIRVRIPEGAVCVEGKRLVCTAYSAGAVGIDGFIDRVSFEEL